MAQEVTLSREDRDRLVRIEGKLEAFIESTNQRFEDLHTDMNARFEQVDKRFEEQQSFLQMIVAAFAGLSRWFGFALWDRRTMIKAASKELQAQLEQYSVQREQQIVERAVQESYERIEVRGLPRHFVTLLRERASCDPELSGELKNLGLL